MTVDQIFLHMVVQVLNILGVKHNQSTAYQALSQGELECFHQSLKSILRTYCTELDRNWEEGLLWLMLVAREAAQDSMGFSPNPVSKPRGCYLHYGTGRRQGSGP